MYRLWDSTRVEMASGDFGKTWMTWADVVTPSSSSGNETRIRLDGVRRGATVREPRSELAVVEEATYDGRRILSMSNEATYDADDEGQRPQTVFMMEFDEYEMTTVVGGHGVPLSAFVSLLDNDLSVYEDGGLALGDDTTARVGRRGGVGLVGSGDNMIGTAMVEILDTKAHDHLPKGPGLQLGHGDLWRIDGEEKPTAIYANKTVVARIRALGETSGDAVIELAQDMRLTVREPRSAAGNA